ncbi:MAG: hypothetical protein R2764_01930 [Bacteroidales bacterium]
MTFSRLVGRNGYGDNAYLRFDDQATVGIDKQFDAYKIFGVSKAKVCHMFILTGGSNLSINVLPQTDMLMWFRAGTNGVYTINASEVNGLSYVILKDTTGGN